MKVKYIVYVLLIVGLGALIVYRISSNSKMGNTGPTGPNIAKVSGMILKPRAIKENIVLAGTLEANEEIDIRSEVSGVVESINFQEGTKVSKGQLLLRLNDFELRAQLYMVQTAKKLILEN